MKYRFQLAFLGSLAFIPHGSAFGQQTGLLSANSTAAVEAIAYRFAAESQDCQNSLAWQRLSWAPSARTQLTSLNDIPPFAELPVTTRSKSGFLGLSLNEESPYKSCFKTDGPIVGIGAVTGGAAIIARINQAPLTVDQINRLNPDQIWGIDRSATAQYSKKAGKVSDVLAYGSVALPWLYAIPRHTRQDFGRIATMHFETLLISQGVIALTKMMVHRTRPFTYNPEAALSDKTTFKAKASFFSGHTCTAAAMSFFTATTFSQYYPDSRMKPLVWTCAVAWPAATGYLRYRAGAHFLSDVVVGYLVGATTGMLIPKLHQKFKRSHKAPLVVTGY
jgi:membrane-associated phospholipid phosphatase